MINFTISRKEFLKSLQNVNNAIKDNKAIPALACTYIDVKEGYVELKGSDLELSISAKLSADIKSPGVALIRSDTLQEYLKELDDELIQVIQDNNELKISTNRSDSSYSLVDHNEYPEMVNFTSDTNFTMETEKFVKGIEKTIVGASPTPDNLTVHSVRLDLGKERARFITSDTYRLFFYEDKISGNANIKASLPLKTATSILKIIKNENVNEISIQANKELIYFKIGNVKILSKLIDLPYPDYERILENFEHSVDVLCYNNELISMLKRIQIFAKNNSDIRNSAQFIFKEKSLDVKAISDQSKVEESMLIVKKGFDLSISLNVKFMLDFLQQIEGNVLIYMKDSSSVVMLSENAERKFLTLIMPLSWS